VLSAEGKKTKDAPAEIAKWFASRVAAYKRLKGLVTLAPFILRSHDFPSSRSPSFFPPSFDRSLTRPHQRSSSTSQVLYATTELILKITFENSGVVIQDIIPKSPSGKLLRRSTPFLLFSPLPTYARNTATNMSPYLIIVLRDQAKVEFAAALKAKL
jgi:hypothetical protein